VETPPVRVITASSDPVLRGALRRALWSDHRVDLVGEATDGDAVVNFGEPFDVAVVDLAIGGFGVMGVLSHLSQGDSAPAVIIVSRSDAVYLRHAVEAEGAAGFVVIPSNPPAQVALAGLADRAASIAAAHRPLAATAGG